MAVSNTEKTVCEKCAADVRENTKFCYNCGSLVDTTFEPNDHAASLPNVPDTNKVESQSALADLAKKLNAEEEIDNKLAKAAAERRRSRVNQRKPKEFVWEPETDDSSRMVLLIAILIAVIAAVAVVIVVYIK